MALTKMNTDLNIIAALDDEPNSVGGLSATELKAKFDESGNAIKTYINETLTAETDAHIVNTDNPHTVTAAQVGLGNCDNTADIDKPVSTPQQEALNLKANSDNVLEKNNVAEYNPTANYHPATKKYVDDTVSQAVLGSIPDGTITEVKLDASLTEKINSGAASRPNLLDNAYFGNPVDQRGGYVVPPGTLYYSDTGLSTQVGTVNAYTKVLPFNGTCGIITVDSTTYYVAWSNAVRGYTDPYVTYTIDRWFITGTTMALLVNSDCISFVDTVTDVQIRQKFEKGILESGRTYTISALVKADSSCTLNLIMNSSNGYYGEKNYNIGTEYVLVTHSFVCDGGSNQIFCISDHAANVKYSIKAIKLELGTEQTLAHQDENGNWVLNEIPDYGEQLARCQRYFYKPDKVVLSRTPNTNSFTINANFKTTMRTAPTVAFGTEMTALVPGVTDAAKVSLQYAYIDENGIGDGDFISFTPADAEIFQVKDGQFSFSADL